MYLTADHLELDMVVGCQGFVSLLLKLPDLDLDGRLVDARNLVVLMCIDAEGLAESDQQITLVHLRMALHCLVLDALGYFPKLCHRLLLEFFKGLSHDLDSPVKIPLGGAEGLSLRGGSRFAKPTPAPLRWSGIK